MSHVLRLSSWRAPFPPGVHCEDDAHELLATAAVLRKYNVDVPVEFINEVADLDGDEDSETDDEMPPLTNCGVLPSGPSSFFIGSDVWWPIPGGAASSRACSTREADRPNNGTRPPLCTARFRTAPD